MKAFIGVMIDKVKWQKLRSNGILYYLLVEGYFKLGFGAGFIGITSQYIYDIGASFERFDLSVFLFNYLKWLPAFALLGVFIALHSWFIFSKKFNEKN